MSQTVTPGHSARQRPPGLVPGRPGVAPAGSSVPATGTGGPATGRGRVRGPAAGAMEGTPGRLRLAAAATVLGCVVFALLGASAFQARSSALDEARADAAQLVRVQQIATSVVAADSLFTNGYLSYGLEQPQQQNDYEQAVATALRSIAEASRANPADADDLAVVNQALGQYIDRVRAARANNAQGYQVATGYLRQAADLLRNQNSSPNMLPTLQKLITANTQRVDDAYSASRWAFARLALAALVALGALVVVQVRLARTTHRYLNLPLLTGSVAVLVVLVAGAVVMVGAQSRADDVHDGAYSSTLALARARIAAYSGKSQESITLIYLGTGGDYASAEAAYQKNLTEAKNQVQRASGVTRDDSATQQLLDWDAAHKKIYLQAQTDWIGAAKKATSADPGTVNTTFDALAAGTDTMLTSQATQVDDGLGSHHGALVAFGWLTLVVGLIAAAASWAGIAQRLEEYR